MYESWWPRAVGYVIGCWLPREPSKKLSLHKYVGLITLMPAILCDHGRLDSAWPGRALYPKVCKGLDDFAWFAFTCSSLIDLPTLTRCLVWIIVWTASLWTLLCSWTRKDSVAFFHELKPCTLAQTVMTGALLKIPYIPTGTHPTVFWGKVLFFVLLKITYN